MTSRPSRIAASLGLSAALLALACGHSESFLTATDNQTAPFAGGTDARLTYNGDQDYWPTWTEDSSGVLYAYVDAGRPDHDRCIGLLNPNGGTRIWQMCDNQPGHADSTDSFAGFALGRDGRLLYEEASAKVGTEAPSTKVLWLADSAHPFTRRKLLTLPVQVGGMAVDWLADIAWTGASDFIALAQEYTPVSRCAPHICAADDSAFVGRFVVRGHIDAAGAALTPIAGTDGANSYALAESGNSIVFSQRSGTQLYGVAVVGGTSVLLGNVGGQSTIAGIACRAVTCVVTTDQVTLGSAIAFPSVSNPNGSIFRFTITTGVATLLRTNAVSSNSAMYSSPLIMPNGTDIVLQAGGSVGRLHSAGTTLGDLYLYRGILP